MALDEATLGELLKRAMLGVRRPFEQLQTLANAGDLDALWAMGRLAQDGDGYLTPNTPEAARDFYLRAAEQGHGMSQLCLAQLLDAWGARLNDEAGAQRWYLAAAENGAVNAPLPLARLLEAGRGGPRDLPGAIHWYKRAVELGSGRAAGRLAQIYLRTAKTPADFRIVIDLLEMAGDQHDAQAHYTLGEMHRTGRGTPQDPELALFHYSIAALEFSEKRDVQASLEHQQALAASMPDRHTAIERRAREYVEQREDVPFF